MIASALAGEGKTFTSLNLCLSIAREHDWNVVLVDGDCNKPHLTTLFGAQEEPGLMDLLQDPAKSFQPTYRAFRCYPPGSMILTRQSCLPARE
jgi:Mrp family chromosome partitioning ATPase